MKIWLETPECSQSNKLCWCSFVNVTQGKRQEKKKDHSYKIVTRSLYYVVVALLGGDEEDKIYSYYII